MSDTNNGDLSVTSTSASPTDLVSLYASMASVAAWVQNKGPGQILVRFTASATASAAGGILLSSGDVWTGNAAHCWVDTFGLAAVIGVGLV